MARRRALLEELEPRLLLSADVPGADLDAVDVAPYAPAEIERLESRDAQTTLAAQREGGVHLIFIDGGVEGSERLVEEWLERSAADPGIELSVLDAKRDGLEQMQEVLGTHFGDVGSVHVISHGSAGGLQLGSTWLDRATVQERSDALSGWSSALAPGADLLLYGCDLASSAEGRALVDQLAALTGADVAASMDLTGAAASGGDWELEYHRGEIESAPMALDASEWSGVLAVVTEQTSANASAELLDSDPLGQTFSMPAGSGTYAVDRVSVWLSRDPGVDPGQNLSLEIRDGWNGALVSTALNSVASGGISDSGEWVTFQVAIATPLTLSDGQTYTLQLATDSAAGGITAGYHTGTDAYAPGELLRGAAGTPQTGEDLAFRLELGATAANSPPLITAPNPLDPIDEDAVGNGGNAVWQIVNGSDPDGDALGMAVTGFTSGSGTWQYWDPTLSTPAWTDVPSGLSANDAFLLGDSDLLRFRPDGIRGESPDPTLTFHAWDQTSNAPYQRVDATSSSAFSAATESTWITVSEVNDAPTFKAWALARTFTRDENPVDPPGHSVADILNDPFFGPITQDVDDGVNLRGIAITSLTSPNGTWEYSLGGSGNWVAITPAPDPSNALLLSSADWLRFNPDGLNGGVAVADFRAWDQTSVEQAGEWADTSAAGGSSAFSVEIRDITVTVNPLNDAPELGVVSADLGSIDEDISDAANSGELVSDVIALFSPSDPDTGALAPGIALTRTTGQGTWQYELSSAPGAWNDVGSVSESSARLLGPGDRIRYVPDGDNGEVATFDFKAWDQSNGTSLAGRLQSTTLPPSDPDEEPPYSGAIATASLDVTPRNDAPELLNTSLPMPAIRANQLDEITNPGQSISDLLSGAASDVDLPTNPLGLAITDFAPGNGTWQYKLGGGSWQAIPSGLSVSNALLLGANDSVRLLPDGQTGTRASFDFRVWDGTDGHSAGSLEDASAAGTTGAYSSAAGRATLTVDDANLAPVASDASLSVSENTANGTAVGSVAATDPDALVGWFDPAWSQRKLLIIDAARVAAPLADFPLLVSFALDPELAAGVGRPDGLDILFTSGDGETQLDHQIESFDPATGELTAWVRVPVLSATADTSLFMYYGNAAAPSQENAAGVWDSSYAGVWHLNEGVSTAPGFYADATGNALDATLTDDDADVSAVAGRIGSALELGGNLLEEDFLDVAASPLLNLSQGTMEAWVRPDAGLSLPTTLFQVHGDAQNRGAVFLNVLGQVGYAAFDGGTSTTDVLAPVSISDGQWHHVSVTWQNGLAQLRVDYSAGVVFEIGDESLSFSTDPSARFGAGSSSPGSAFGGQLDELRYSSVARSDAWLQTQHLSQSSPETFVSASAAQSFGLSYAITGGDPTGVFALDATSGQITVADGAQLDHEAQPQYVLTVQVTDSGSPALSATAQITVDVTDLNEFDPVAPDARFSVFENAADGANVGTVLASDADSSQSLSYAITGGDPSGIFAIDAVTGAITVADAAQLDHESAAQHRITVTVADDGAPQRSATVTVTVDVQDINEFDPAVTDESFAIEENAANGTVVGTVGASDADSSQTLSYAITGGNPTGIFTIDAVTGAITVVDTAQLDHESAPQHQLTVTVTDDGVPQRSGTGTVTVNIQDRNEFDPVVTGASFALLENAANGTAVGTVGASDADASQTLRYAISGGDPGGAFAIDTATGQIRVADGAQLDYESQSSYALTVRVTDDGSPARSGAATIAISLIDGNDAPVLSAVGHTLGAIDEDQTSHPGERISDVLDRSGAVWDADAAALQGVAVTGLTSGNGAWEYRLDGNPSWSPVDPSVSPVSALLLGGDDWIRFVPDSQNADAADFSFRAWDQTLGARGTYADASPTGPGGAFSVASDRASIAVQAVNDAPVLLGPGGNLPTIDEDIPSSLNAGAQVQTLAPASLIQDVDLGALPGIAITDLVSGNGTWEFSIDGGATWNAVGAVSESRALLLDLSHQIRFVPDALNADSASVLYRAWDQSSGQPGQRADATPNGVSSAFSSAVNTASISVTPLNDAPSLGDAALASLPGQLDSASVQQLFGGLFRDVDAGSSLSGIAVVGNGVDPATEGVWEYSTDGQSWFPIGAVGDDASALALAASTELRFVPASTYGGQSEIQVRALDDTYAGAFSSTAGGSEARVQVNASVHGGTAPIAAARSRIAGFVQLAPEPEPDVPGEAADPDSDATRGAPAPEWTRAAGADEPPQPTRVALDRVDFAAPERRGERPGAVDFVPAGERDLRRGRPLLAGAQQAPQPAPPLSAQLFQTLDGVRSELDDGLLTLEQRPIVLSSVAMTMGLSVGYLLWLTRGGLLVASLLSQLPAWRFIDPLPVLSSFREDADGPADNGDSLAGLLQRRSVSGGARDPGGGSG